MTQKGENKLQLKESIKPPKVEQLVEVRVSERIQVPYFHIKTLNIIRHLKKIYILK